jgi:hypothetical protein
VVDEWVAVVVFLTNYLQQLLGGKEEMTRNKKDEKEKGNTVVM